MLAPDFTNFLRTKIRRFLTGSYIDRRAAQAAFDRHRERDALGDRVMTWLALLAAAGLLGPTVISELAFAPLLVFFFVRTNNTFPAWVHWFGQPMFLLVLAWSGWQAITLLWSRDLTLGLGELGQNRWALLGVLVWPIIHKRRAILAALAVGFAVAHLAQFAQFVGIQLAADGSDPVFGRDPRRISGWWDPVVGGSMLVGAIGLHLPAAVFYRGKSRWIARAGVVAATLGVIATGSRGAWLASAMLLVGTLALALWKSSKSTRNGAQPPRWRKGILVCIITLLLGAALWLTVGASITSRVQQARDEIRLAAQGDTNSDIGHRIDMYEWAGRAVLARPIRGVGAGGYRAWVEETGGPFVFDHAHSSAAHIGATTGLIGLGLWGLIVVVVIRNCVIHIKQGEEALGQPGSMSGPLCAIVGLLLVSAFDVVHLNAQTAALFWLLAGLCVTWEPSRPDADRSAETE